MTVNIVVDALIMTWFRRRAAPMLIHHCDRGSHYASGVFQDKLIEFSMTCSMIRKGNCWDNAPTESLFNSLKNERVHGTRHEAHEAVRTGLFDYIEAFCNRNRRHSRLDYRSPAQFLQHWITTQAVRQLAP
jgi:putative transposase